MGRIVKGNRSRGHYYYFSVQPQENVIIESLVLSSDRLSLNPLKSTGRSMSAGGCDGRFSGYIYMLDARSGHAESL